MENRKEIMFYILELKMHLTYFGEKATPLRYYDLTSWIVYCCKRSIHFIATFCLSYPNVYKWQTLILGKIYVLCLPYYFQIYVNYRGDLYFHFPISHYIFTIAFGQADFLSRSFVLKTLISRAQWWSYLFELYIFLLI